MYKIVLDIKSMEDAKKLVDIVRRYDFGIDMMSHQYVIDAKSILGLLSLDLCQPVQLYARCKHASDCKDLMKKVSIFAHDDAQVEFVED